MLCGTTGRPCPKLAYEMRDGARVSSRIPSPTDGGAPYCRKLLVSTAVCKPVGGGVRYTDTLSLRLR
jgi:hypothetical protein